MASNLSCIGLAVEDPSEFEELVQLQIRHADLLGSVRGIDIHRWQDPSGARTVIGVERGEIVDFLPSFEGRPGVRLAHCTATNADVVTGDVVDSDGMTTTRMSFELEQRRALRPGEPWSGPASVTAFGWDTHFFADAEEFGLSEHSLLDPTADPALPTPSEYAERGLRWPPRMAEESFFPVGAFGEDEDVEAVARLNGIVLESEHRRNVLTGQSFLVARVRFLGADVDLVTAWGDAPLPAVGSVAAARVFLVASIDDLEFPRDATPSARRTFFRRRRR